MAKDDDLRPDVAAAKQRMRTRVGSGREIKNLASHLWEGEQVEKMTKGSYGTGIGLLVLTDRRVLFLKEGIVGKKTEDFPLDKISSVQWSSGLATGTVTIFASGNKAEIKNVHKEDGKEITELVRHRISAPQPGHPVSSAGPEAVSTPDIPDQIRKLGELRDQGLVTSEEFEAKKAELLSRL